MQNLKLIILSLIAILWAGVAAAQADYRLQAGDVLAIEVLEDPSLNREIVVLPDGRINFPFAGSVQAAGRSISQVQNAVTTAIQSNFSTPPTVFVSVRPAQERFATTPESTDTVDIYLLGEVNNPGLLTVDRGTTLLQGMALGGGVTRFAAVKRIQLRRTDPTTGMQNVIKFNYRALSNGTASQTIELKDGDVILVPERRLFE